jgi:hypothetical protein
MDTAIWRSGHGQKTSGTALQELLMIGFRCSGWVTALLILGSATAGVAAPPTMDEINGAFDQKDYKKCLKLCSGVLQLKGELRQAYDLNQIWMKIGESAVQLNDRPTAINAFARAAEYAKTVDARVLAQGTSMIVEKSNGMVYTLADGTKSDIRNPESRTAAMKDLSGKMTLALRPSVAKALESATLVQTMKLLPQLRELVVIEHAAYGKIEESAKLIVPLGEHARTLMIRETKRMTSYVNEIRDLSQMNQSVVIESFGGTRRALGGDQERELREMLAELQQIEKAATRARAKADEYGGKVEAWDGIIAAVTELADKIEVTLGN